MTRVLWCNPAVGVAGDMLLGALVDLGADRDRIREQLGRLGLDGWTLDCSPTTRRGLVATRAEVGTAAHDHHRPWSRIDAMLAGVGLDPFVEEGARRTFRRLGEAEARVHGIELDEVHFHEVGALDAIVDIVGTWAALHTLDVDAVHSAPIGLGTGTATMAHGTVPVPAPATLELLVGVPCVGIDAVGETATPTGVALLTTMVERWGAITAGVVEGIGRGAGHRDPDTHANVVTAVVLAVPDADAAADAEPLGPLADGAGVVESLVVETNLDDVTPEVLGHVVDRVLQLGADDVWVAPVTMKKQRPAHQLRVLCRPELAEQVRELIAAETGTLGLRQWPVAKYELPRRVEHVLIDGCEIAMKVGPHGAKPEHDDLVAASTALGRPVRALAAEAVARWRGAVD
jgi:uncharacterized protein (TIGR00299 family) protein